MPKNIKVDIDLNSTINKRNKKNVLVIVVLILILLTAAIIDLCIGPADFGLSKLIAMLTNSASGQDALIFTNSRLPHVLCAIVAGLGLSIAGCILQSCLGNPLASPSTIGISQGAAFGACFSIIVLGGNVILGSMFSTAIFAFIFALLPALLIYVISKFSALSKTTIILTGVGISLFFGGLVALIEYFADSSKVAEVLFWTFGSMQNASYETLIFMFAVVVVSYVITRLNAINLNAMECGDTIASTVGINVSSLRLGLLILASISAACITAFCGTIAFVGLIAPHIMRKFVGSNYKILVPASALTGSIIVLLADIISLVLLPGAVLPIGAILSIIGAPIFVCILVKKKM